MRAEIKTKYEGPWAEGPELSTFDVGDWKVQYPVVNTSKCGHCGTCYLFCPTGCVEDQGAYFKANLEFCKGCGVCAAECPARAIAMVMEKQNHGKREG